MYDQFDLEQTITDQKRRFIRQDTGIERKVDFERYNAHNGIVILSGIRRSGKSTLLGQFKRYYDHFGYINFDDDRLIDITPADLQTLLTLILKDDPDTTCFFFDEIQNVRGWERFIRRLHDEGYKIFVTGSNANLLSSELGTHLTGRYVKIEVWPFSFLEILDYKNISARDHSTHNHALMLRELDCYLEKGGFPEFISYNEPEFVKRTYEDILYRDIVARYSIREVNALKNLGLYLMTNYTNEFSYNSLKQVTGLKSDTSVRNFIKYFCDAYLFFECYRYEYSLKRQIQQAKKAYTIDSGMRNLLSLRFSKDLGRSLENQVFIELMRRGYDAWFFKGDGECDFLVKDETGLLAIQVCSEVTRENHLREVSGLLEAAEKAGAYRGLIITLNQRSIPDEWKQGAETFQVIPVWEWFTKN